MATVEKVYEVLEDRKYTGKHNVFTAGQKFKESELFGDLEVALKGIEKHGIKPAIKLSVEDKKTKASK